MGSSLRILFALTVFAAVIISEIHGQSPCLNEHNAERNSRGKGPLTRDSRLEQAAKKHNNMMIQKNCFSHQCSGEPKVGDRAKNEGYQWSRVGENIAANQNDCKAVMQSWMDSQGHRENILGDFKNVGCARTECSNCKWKIYWTCVFGKQQ